MKYSCYSDNVRQGPYTIAENITDGQFESIKAALEYIINVSNEMDYWILLEGNVIKLKANFEHAEEQDQDRFVFVNGSYANFLASYYLWKCYNKHFGGVLFDDLLKVERDKHIECRLISELRNYLAHSGFVITEYEFDVLNEKEYFYISPEMILLNMEKKRKIGKKKNVDMHLVAYLKELTEKEEKIEAYVLLKAFWDIYPGMQKQLWERLEDKVREHLKTIFLLVPSHYPDLYNTYMISEDNENYLNLGQPLHYFLCKAKKYYPQFLKV